VAVREGGEVCALVRRRAPPIGEGPVNHAAPLNAETRARDIGSKPVEEGRSACTLTHAYGLRQARNYTRCMSRCLASSPAQCGAAAAMELVPIHAHSTRVDLLILASVHTYEHALRAE
jgi:hypothetical protein